MFFSASHRPLVCVCKQVTALMHHPGHRICTFLIKKECLDMSEKSASPAVYLNNQCSWLSAAICLSTKLCAPAEPEAALDDHSKPELFYDSVITSVLTKDQNCSYREILLILCLLQQNNTYCLSWQTQFFVKALNPNIYTVPVSTPASHPLISAHGKEKPCILLNWVGA